MTGYKVRILTSSAIIPWGDLVEADNSIHEFNEENGIPAGDTEETLKHVGFTTFDSHRGLMITGYHQQAGMEDKLLGFLTEFIVDNSVIEWGGEDGRRWDSIFQGNRMTITMCLDSYY